MGRLVAGEVNDPAKQFHIWKHDVPGCGYEGQLATIVHADPLDPNPATWDWKCQQCRADWNETDFVDLTPES